MNKDRLWVIAGALGIAIIVVMGYLLGISPILAMTTDAGAQAASLNTANAGSVTRLAELKTQYENIGESRSELAALRKSIPTGANMPLFLDEINALCKKNHVELTSVVVNDATIYAAPAAAAGTATTDTTSTATPTPTPTPTTTTAPVATTPAAAATAGSLVLVPVVITVTGKFDNVMKFAGGAQAGERLYLVGQFAVNPGGADDGSGATSNKFTGTLTGTVFSLAGISDAATSTPTPEPTATETPTPTSTPTGTPGSTSTSTATP